MARTWTFLSNHAHVLLHVFRDPAARVEDIARGVGITPRACLLILDDLEQAGYLHRVRAGRRNRYSVLGDRPFRHPASSGHTVAELLAVFAAPPDQPPGVEVAADSDRRVTADAPPEVRGDVGDGQAARPPPGVT